MRACEIFVVYLSVTYVSGWLEAIWPDCPPVLLDSAVALVSVLMLEALVSFLILRPSITFGWKEHGNPNALPRLDMSSAKLNSGQVVYELAITGKNGTGLFGRPFMKWLVRNDLEIAFGVPAAPLFMTADLSRPVLLPKSVREDPMGNGLIARFTRSPPADTWVWCRVIFNANAVPTNDSFSFEFKPTTSTTLSKAAAGRFLKITTSASKVTTYS